MRQDVPPSWLESVLLLLLPARDRETVSGDLREEFGERMAAGSSRLPTSLWYIRQVASFAPRRVRAALVQATMLRLLCLFTALCGSWLGLIELRLRHPGYAGRGWIAITIVGEALLTLAALRFSRTVALRALAMAGSVGLFWLGGGVWASALRGGRPEGYVLLIGLALIIQGLLTLSTLPGVPDRQQPEDHRRAA